MALHGRLEAVARALHRVERACAGEGGLLLLSGEPGIGKSRLAEHVAEIARGAGCAVVWGRCWEAGGAPAYWPWIQVFRELQMEEDPFAEGGQDLGGNAEAVRFRAFDRAVTRLKERARQSPLVLVLDDLHAADVPSLLLLLLLARELRRAPILVLGGYRDAPADLAPDVAALLEKIGREGEILPLRRLGPEHVAAWMQEAFPDSSPEQMAAVYQLTEGHPLFVTEVLRGGFERLTRRSLLDGLRSVLDERLARLPERTRAALEVAAVLGREFSAADVAAAGGMPLDEVDRALRDARDARIVASADRHAEQMLFSHVLLRDRLYAELPPSKKAAHHWSAGAAKLARGDDPAAAAHHLLEGHSAGDPAQAAAVALTAAQRALDRFAFEEAVQLCRRAVSLPALRARPSRVEGELGLVLSQALMRMGNAAEGKKVCTQVSNLARQLGAGDLFADAALVYGSSLFAPFGDAQVVLMLREALARLEPAPTAIRARVMARLAAALNPPHPADIPEILALARGAVAIARGLGDDHQLLQVLQSAVYGLVYLADEDARFALLQEIVRLGRGLDQKVAVMESLGWYIGALFGNGQPALAALELKAYQTLVAEFPQPHFRWRLPLAQALEQAFGGAFDEADRLSEEAHGLALSSGSAPGIRAWAVQRVSFAQMRGRPELIAKDAAEVMAVFEPIQAQIPSTAWILAATGQREAAARRLRSAKMDPSYFPGLVFAADTCLMLGERELADALYAPLCAFASRQHMFWGPAGASAFGPTSRVLGDVARLTGRAAEAVAHYADAMEFCERMGAQPFTLVVQRAWEQARAEVAAAAAGVPATGVPAVAPEEVTPAVTPEVAASAPTPPGGARFGLWREGEIWSVDSPTGPSFRLKHSKGLAYLQYLLEQSGRQVHVLELAGVEHAVGDAGPVLDARAKAEYRRRLDELSEELREAERWSDLGRRQRAQQELDAVADQLARALGSGGRDRLVASDIQRARINVQRRLRDVLDRIGVHDPALARQLSAALQTGTYCCLEPLGGPARA